VKLYNLLWSKWYQAKCDLAEWVARHAPKIKTRKPEPTGYACPSCGEPCNKICATDTGEGWAFFWECPNNCGFGDPYFVDITWYPFYFGVYCNWRDLERAGIEVV
jgi:transcription elongation factor Elf1